jgi:hypothetical protein
MLADAQPRARSVPALALLLDVDTWVVPTEEARAEPASQVEASAALLRGAGWRVAVVRRGMTTAQAWRLLLVGTPAAGHAVAALGL